MLVCMAALQPDSQMSGIYCAVPELSFYTLPLQQLVYHRNIKIDVLAYQDGVTDEHCKLGYGFTFGYAFFQLFVEQTMYFRTFSRTPLLLQQAFKCIGYQHL